MTLPGVEAYSAANGVKIYRLPLELFPGLNGYATLILHEDHHVLLDVGSGFGDSNQQLEEGLARVRDTFGERVGWDTLTCVLISHGHIDHYGGLRYVRRQTRAPVGIHRLDLTILTDFEERLQYAENGLRAYLSEAGVPPEKREEVMNLYLLHKQLFSAVEVDFTLDRASQLPPFIEVFHVPGHCPGQIVLRVDDVLLCSDHILPHITPHQAPERLSFHTGLSHYLESLRRTLPFARGVSLGLGGHEGPITDVAARVRDIFASHQRRFEVVLEMLCEPATVFDVSQKLFHDLNGYDKLLAIEEAGAHIEYLFNEGLVSVVNMSEVNHEPSRPYRYQAKKGTLFQPLPLIAEDQYGEAMHPSSRRDPRR
jgi:glyoxylase-like metal-dependent hydrolase (beta-lactamase superfamily II)